MIRMKLVILLCLLTVMLYAADDSSDDMFVIEDSLDEIVNEAAARTKTENTDRKQKEFDELSGRKRPEKNTAIEEGKKQTTDASEKTPEPLIQPEESTGTTFENETAAPERKEILPYSNSPEFTSEHHSFTDDSDLSDHVYHIKKIRIKSRIKSENIRIKKRMQKNIAKLEFFTFNQPVKIHKLLIITADGRAFTKDNLTIERNHPYILNLMNNSIQRLIIVYNGITGSEDTEYLYLLGIRK